MRRALDALSGRFDLVVAASLFALGAIEALFLAPDSSSLSQLALTPIWTLPLIWRRRWPVPVLALVVLIGPALDLVNAQGGIMSFVIAAILTAYTVGRELDAPSTWWGPALTVGFGWLAYAVTDGILSDYVFTAVLYGGAWAVGYAIRRRDLQVGELTAQTLEMGRSHEEQKRRAVEQERGRIARELHDIVSHSISVITIQAQVARRRLPASSGEEAEALLRIETTARQAMVEMRRLLGVLRSGDEPPALSPQPSLEQLADLVAEAGADGVEVQVASDGDPVDLPAGLALTAYRTVQEALTNVRKHTEARSARVKLSYLADRLEISVKDAGPARPSGVSDGSGGLGLAGMEERVKLYGGSLSAGPLAEGGFEVRAVLPLSPSGSSSL